MSRRIVGATLLFMVLVPAAVARPQPRTITLHFPRFSLPARSNPEACVAFRVGVRAPFDLASVTIRHRGIGRNVSAQHFLVYLYTGADLGAFPKRGPIVQSRGCLDLGPADRDRRQLVASGTIKRSQGSFAPGTAVRLPSLSIATKGTGLGFVLDGEWVNGDSRPHTVSVAVVLHRARKKSAAAVALPFSDQSAEAGLDVPPGELRSTEMDPAGRTAGWGPGRPGAPTGDICVRMITGQMHKRGRFLGIDVVNADGTVRDPGTGVANPFEPGRRHLFGGFDWTDMGSITLPEPVKLTAGDTLHTLCWTDNGVARAVRLGCEETAGVPPGAVGQPAKPCGSAADCGVTDPAYPGRTFTGVCEPAVLVAGTGIEDEICRLDGIYVPAGPDGSCGP